MFCFVNCLTLKHSKVDSNFAISELLGKIKTNRQSLVNKATPKTKDVV